MSLFSLMAGGENNIYWWIQLEIYRVLFGISFFHYINAYHLWYPLAGTVALTWLCGLWVPVTRRAMPAQAFTPLVGPPKPERSRSRVQTKDSPTTLQMWRLGLRLTTPSCKKALVTEKATKTTNNLHADLPRSSNPMTACGESWKETTGVKLEVMSAKTKTRIGFWNVSTMYETGKCAQVTAEMRQYNMC